MKRYRCDEKKTTTENPYAPGKLHAVEGAMVEDQNGMYVLWSDVRAEIEYYKAQTLDSRLSRIEKALGIEPIAAPSQPSDARYSSGRYLETPPLVAEFLARGTNCEASQ